MARLNGRPWMTRLRSGDIGLGHYQSILVETYHNVGMNPQHQAFATMYLPGKPRDLIKKFYQHAISEIAHDMLALNDLKAMGIAEHKVINSRPLPETVAFMAFPVFQTQLRGPLGYLGYLYHLERLPTGDGGKYVAMLKSLGVKDDALTFLEEHATVDVAHNKMMDSYIIQLVRTQAECDELIHQIRAAAKLHVLMLEGALERAEAQPNWLDDL